MLAKPLDQPFAFKLTEPSKPVRYGNPTLGRFDSGAAPSEGFRLPEPLRRHCVFVAESS